LNLADQFVTLGRMGIVEANGDVCVHGSKPGFRENTNRGQSCSLAQS
jgi:hypothetical protein